MEKINGGTLESFIKRHKSLNNNSQKKIAESEDGSSTSTKGKREKIISEEVAASITKDICNALLHIHIKNFIHRDLKPENILISEEFNEDGTQPETPSERYSAKIADFGLSAEVHANVFHG